MSNQSGSLRVRGPGADSKVETISKDIDEVSVDGMFGADRLFVQSLTGTPVQRVNINLTDNLARDGMEDVISIHGTPMRDELLIENVDATLMNTPTDVPPVIGGVIRISGFRSHAQTIDDHYEVYAMNFQDRLLVNSRGGDDLVTISRLTTRTTTLTS